MQKTSYILAIVLATLLFSHCTSNDRALHRRLQQEASLLNITTPQMLNNFIRLDGASVTSDNRFQYRYTVLNTLVDNYTIESWLQDFERIVRDIYFNNPNMAIFRDNNVIMEYIFSNEAGEIIREFQVHSEVY